MKELVLRQVVDLPAKLVWEKTFKQDSFALECHAALCHSNVVLRAWDSQCERMNEFTVHLQLTPAILSLYFIDEAPFPVRVGQKQKYATNTEKYVIQSTERFYDSPFANDICLFTRITIQPQGNQSRMTLLLRCEYSGAFFEIKDEIEGCLAKFFEEEMKMLYANATKKSFSPSLSVFSERPFSKELLNRFEHEDTENKPSQGLSEAIKVVLPITPESSPRGASSKSANIEKILTPKKSERTTTPPSISEESPQSSTASSSTIPATSASVIIAPSDYSIISHLRTALEESSKERSLLNAKVRELEQKLSNIKLEHSSKSKKLSHPDMQEILGQLNATMIEFADIQEQKKRLDEKIHTVMEDNRRLKDEVQVLTIESNERGLKIADLSERVEVLSRENEGYRKTLNTLVNAEAPTYTMSPKPMRRPSSMEFPPGQFSSFS